MVLPLPPPVPLLDFPLVVVPLLELALLDLPLVVPPPLELVLLDLPLVVSLPLELALLDLPLVVPQAGMPATAGCDDCFHALAVQLHHRQWLFSW